MKVLLAASREIWGLFVGDLAHTIAMLVWLAIVAALAHALGDAEWLGPVLFLGLAAILIESVDRAVRTRKRSRGG